MKNPKVSIIIPVYNGEKTLKQCLNSIVKQTYKNYEVIVIDNNSTDKTKNIIKELQRKNKKIKYIFEPKIGIGPAKNAGIKNSSGEIIATIDSDCIAGDDWLSVLTKPLIFEKEKMVVWSLKNIEKDYWSRQLNKADIKLFKRLLQGKYIAMAGGGNFAIKSKIIKKYLFDKNLKILEDLDFYIRIRNNFKVRFLPSCKVGIYYESSLSKIIKKRFNSGYWSRKLYLKHKNKINILEIPAFEPLTLKNNLTFPFWMISQFIKGPIGEAYFIMVSGLSWRAGVIWSMMKNG